MGEGRPTGRGLSAQGPASLVRPEGHSAVKTSETSAGQDEGSRVPYAAAAGGDADDAPADLPERKRGVPPGGPHPHFWGCIHSDPVHNVCGGASHSSPKAEAAQMPISGRAGVSCSTPAATLSLAGGLFEEAAGTGSRQFGVCLGHKAR